MKTLQIIAVIFVIVFSACESDEKTEPKQDDSEPIYTFADFPIGVAVAYDQLMGNSVYKQKTTSQFNSITAENIFKPSYLHPEQNRYEWTEADALADYCAQNGKRLHGHTLIWHIQLPNWMENFAGTDAEWEAMLKDHVQTIMKRYKGKAESWDVVNEAVNDDGTWRETVWFKHFGIDYIAKAFRYAHEADPEAKLFYNDYNLTTLPAKRAKVVELIKMLKADGVPIHGIGMQMHINIEHPNVLQVREALDDFIDEDLLIHWAEIDISVNPDRKENIDFSDALLEHQASKMSYVTKEYLKIPEQLRFGMTFWGVSDANSWLRHYFKQEDYPLLYDDDYEPKPMYFALKDALSE